MRPEPNSRPWRGWLTLACDSAQGQVAAIAALLERQGAYVEAFSVFDDEADRRFYLRCAFRLEAPDPAPGIAALGDGLAGLAARWGHATARLHDRDRPPRALMLVSRADHCLLELLAQRRRGELPVEWVGVASNHPDLRAVVEAEGLPFHHLPVDAASRPAQEAALLALTEREQAEFVVLARYMQVLTPSLAAALTGRAVNIHHSFLPGFKGARPYEQAWQRGVKLIGATAHFVTEDLDEGPIIEQAVERVDHAHDPQALLQVGRHLESVVLARALHALAERRVFIAGRRTVVLR